MKKPLLLNFDSNFELTEEITGITEQLNIAKKMTDTINIAQINSAGKIIFYIGFHPPAGMKWDEYGNPEFI